MAAKAILDQVSSANTLTEVETLLASEEAESQPRVRYAIAEAVAERPELEPSRVLQRLLRQDPDSTVRAAAARLLGEIQAATASSDLLHACDTDAAENVVLRAAESLGVLGEKAAVPRLAALLTPSNALGARLIAATALGQIRTPDARAALREAIETQRGMVVGAAARALLEGHAKDDLEFVRRMAARGGLLKRRRLTQAMRRAAAK